MKTRLHAVNDRVASAAKACGRDPACVRLVAVSKTVSADRVREAIESGVKILGENYVQEARTKFNTLAIFPVEWHFIGHLQSNKAKYAVRLFDLIHSVDSLRLALEINKQAQKINKIQAVLIQVNIGKQSTKSGISPAETLDLLKEIQNLESLSVQGLMTMPPFFDDPENARPYFSALRDLRDRLRRQNLTHRLDELSMGMTGDFETAIQEGATLVRIGTAIFGERK